MEAAGDRPPEWLAFDEDAHFLRVLALIFSSMSRTIPSASGARPCTISQRGLSGTQWRTTRIIKPSSAAEEISRGGPADLHVTLKPSACGFFSVAASAPAIEHRAADNTRGRGRVLIST